MKSCTSHSSLQIYMFSSLTNRSSITKEVEYLSRAHAQTQRKRVMSRTLHRSTMSHVLLLDLTLILSAAAIVSNSSNGSQTHRLLVAFQAPWNVSFPFSARRLGSAIQIAVEKVNNNPSFLGNYSLDFVYKDTDCNPKESLGEFIQQVWRENVTALFGPACPEEAEVWVFCKVYCLFTR